ncbi:hypothetical protein DPR48_23340, partial [Salmonella enterica subsp. enterica serovar Schwarzengrund]|nr:hypothetical protein [Salmonella enterica subsp. enterica serovar Schwarzengrund]
LIENVNSFHIILSRTSLLFMFFLELLFSIELIVDVAIIQMNIVTKHYYLRMCFLRMAYGIHVSLKFRLISRRQDN